jgi:hypothetical protein
VVSNAAKINVLNVNRIINVTLTQYTVGSRLTTSGLSPLLPIDDPRVRLPC